MEDEMKRYYEAIMKIVFMLAATVSVLMVLTICWFLFSAGLPAMREIGITNFVSGSIWKPLEGEFGILPMIVGSCYVTAGAMAVGVPVGLLCAIYMASFCPSGIYKILKPSLELLAGIPSIVYGFFALMVIVPVVQDLTGTSGKGVLAASLVLGIMILPTIVSVSETALRSVPESYYEGALALGATHEKSVFFVTLPAAKSGIMAGIILAIGRAVGETMAVTMVAGNQAILPESLTSGVRTMTANIVLEMGYAAKGMHRDSLIATAVVLFVFILIINVCFSLMKRGEKR